MNKYRLLTYLFPLLFSLLISIPLIIPFFHKGYFPTHDGEWAVVRLGDMYRELKDHQFPPRYSGHLNFGYGYPLFNFAYPFPYYLGAVLLLGKLGLVTSIKVLFALSVPISALGMYLLASAFWKNKLAGMLAAVLYIYYPYRLVDLYVRGSIGECLAFALYPFICYLLYKVAKNYSLPTLLTGGVLFGVLIVTHNIMAVLFLPLLFFFALLLAVTYGNKIPAYAAMVLLFGLLVSTFFWVPALAEKSYILLSKIPIADRSLYFVKLSQLVIPSWGFRPPTEDGGFTYQLGIPHIIIYSALLLCVVFGYVKKRESLHPLFRQGAMLLIFCAILLFFLFEPSSFLWRSLPLLSEINYPWILLGPIGFLISFGVGFLTQQNKYIRVLSIICAIAALAFVSYAKPEKYVDWGDGFYLSNDATTTSSRELMPLWVKTLPAEKPVEKVQIRSGKGTISAAQVRSNHISFLVETEEQSTLRINTIFYPGWQITLDNRPTAIRYDNPQGVMEILVPQGIHNIEGIFKETSLRTTANTISLVSLTGVICVYAYAFLQKMKYLSPKRK